MNSRDPAFQNQLWFNCAVAAPRHYTPSSKIDLLDEGIDRYLGIKEASSARVAQQLRQAGWTKAHALTGGGAACLLKLWPQ